MIILTCVLVMLVLLAVDLITKAWAAAVSVNQDFIGELVRFRYTENHGMAFGMLSDNRTGMIIVTALTVVMIIGIAVACFTLFKKNRVAQITLAVIEAGAIGNLIDRLILGYVRDFVDVSKFGFGVCNLADFFITGGAVVLVVIILFVGEDAVIPLGKNRKKKQEKKDE